MFVEILKTIWKLLKKNIVFVIIFFILNLLTIKFSLNENNSFEILIAFKLLQNILLIAFIIILSKSMNFNINYKKAVMYFVFYSLIDLLQIFLPPLLTMVLILKMFLIFFPYLYFAEDLGVNNSISFSMTLLRELYINIVLLFVNYYTIMTFAIFILIKNELPKLNPENINPNEIFNLLGGKIEFILSADIIIKILIIAGIYFAFKLNTEKKIEIEE
ncbi:hypothetical protein [Streptobacillus canis]|uniref:hypothetical protein n=1 Tax=Streptobacillus canis TaxID=2678686 RepID=UPI0012E16B38|nr:hypothetical protein [Streptobacillus canis]